MEDENKIFALMTHAEDMQKIAEEMVENAKKNNKNLAENTLNLQKMLNEAIEKLPHAYEKAVQQEISQQVKNTIENSIKLASQGLNEMVNASKYAGDRMSRIWRNGGLILLSVAILLTPISYGIQHVLTLNLKSEAQKYQNFINTAEKTVAELNAKTWGLKLVSNDKGKFIVIPKNKKADTGWTVGENPAIKLE